MADGKGSGVTPLGYQREQGILGALLVFGRDALDVARAAGWSPELARRPQIAALGAWLVAEMEAGSVVDIPTAVDRYQQAPPVHPDAPDYGTAILLLTAAPNLGPVTVADIPAHVALVLSAHKAERVAELQVALKVAMQRGDLVEVGKIGARIAAVTAPPRPARAPQEAPPTDAPDDRRTDPATIAALKKIPKHARDDRRVQARVVLENDPRWADLRYNEMTDRIEEAAARIELAGAELEALDHCRVDAAEAALIALACARAEAERLMGGQQLPLASSNSNSIARGQGRGPVWGDPAPSHFSPRQE